MEIADNLVDLEATLNATSFLALLVEAFGVVFARALLDSLATAESPASLRIGFSNFVASVAATRFDSINRRLCTIACTTVFRVQVFGAFVG